MAGWLVYHPKRVVSKKNGITIYHDKTSNNQDPYIWNERFLHTFCHMSQIKEPKEGDIIFWISGDTFPNFEKLFCDLVFVIERKDYWKEKNSIDSEDEIVDSKEAFVDHYRWVKEHSYKRRSRYTLKANPKLSFQPQDKDKNLVNIEKILCSNGYKIELLREKIVTNCGARPLRLDDELVQILYSEIYKNSDIKLYGKQLQEIRKKCLELASK